MIVPVTAVLIAVVLVRDRRLAGHSFGGNYVLHFAKSYPAFGDGVDVGQVIGKVGIV